MSADDMTNVARVTLDVLAAYIGRSQRGDGPAITRRPVDEVMERLELRRWIREGNMNAQSFERFLNEYLEHTTRLHHPGYLAHQVAPPDEPSCLADLIHGATNNPMMVYEMGPAGAAIEMVVVEWMLKKIGWQQRGAGILTHGGSLGNLTALLAARAKAAPESWKRGVPSDLAVLAPPSAHYSIRRAGAILGLGEDGVVPIETDALERIRVECLPTVLARARAQKRHPMAVVVNACATATGLYDELAPVARFCQAEGLWLHVDGAHGAAALLSERHRHLLDGIELADSVVWDAHKMMRTSALCTGVLFRRPEDLHNAFQQRASYILYEDSPWPDLAGYSLETTKATLGLKLFLNLAWRGERALGAYVEKQYEKAQRFHAQIQARAQFECPYAPQSNVLCFRYGHDDALQLAIRDRLMDEGSFHITSTELGGERYLRLSVMSPASDEDTIDALLTAIERGAA